MTFKENLKDEMEYQGLSLKELAFKSGISKGSLSNYLKENCSIPAADIAVKIAAALNVSVEYLVNGTSDNPNQPQHKNYTGDIRLMADQLSTLSEEKRKIVKNLINDLIALK